MIRRFVLIVWLTATSIVAAAPPREFSVDLWDWTAPCRDFPTFKLWAASEIGLTLHSKSRFVAYQRTGNPDEILRDVSALLAVATQALCIQTNPQKHGACSTLGL